MSSEGRSSTPAYRCNCGATFPSHLARTAHAGGCEAMQEGRSSTADVLRERIEAADLFLLASVQRAWPLAQDALIARARGALRGDPAAMAEYREAQSAAASEIAFEDMTCMECGGKPILAGTGHCRPCATGSASPP